MGLRHSFVIVVSRMKVDGLLQAVARHLAPVDQARLAAALPWRPLSECPRPLARGDSAIDARGVAELSLLGEHEEQNSWCFSFTIGADAAIMEYLSDPNNSNERAQSNEQASIGCVWTSLCAGDSLAVLRATAATSRMSRLFCESAAIRSTWADIFREAAAEALFFDTEEEEWELLAPCRRRTRRPDEEGLCFMGDYHFSVDDYYRAAIALAGR